MVNLLDMRRKYRVLEVNGHILIMMKTAASCFMMQNTRHLIILVTSAGINNRFITDFTAALNDQSMPESWESVQFLQNPASQQLKSAPLNHFHIIYNIIIIEIMFYPIGHMEN